MTKITTLRTVLTIILSLSSLTPALSTPPKDILDIIPQNALFCARINSFDYALYTLEQFLSGLSPMPISIMGRMQLGTLLGDPNLTTVNTAGTFAVFAIPVSTPNQPPDTAQALIIGLIPVKNYNDFVTGNSNCSAPDADGISTLGTKMLVADSGGYALIANVKDRDKFLALTSSDMPKLAATIAPDQSAKARTAAIWAYVNMEQVSSVFGPVIAARLDDMKKMINTASQNNQPSAQFINIYFDFIKAFINETKTLTAVIKPTPIVCNLNCTVTAKPGTQLASMLQQDPAAATGNPLMGYLPDGAVFNFAGKMNCPAMKKFNEKMLDLVTSMMAAKSPPQTIEKIKSLYKNYFEYLGDNMAFAYLPDTGSKPPIAFSSAVQIKDPNAMKQFIRQGFDIFNTELAAFYEETMKIKISLSPITLVENYKDVPIESAKMQIKILDPNAPGAKELEQLYGQSFEFRWAYVNGLLVCASGSSVQVTIHDLIDNALSAIPPQPGTEVTTALALIPDSAKADFAGTLNYIRIFQTIFEMTPTPLPVRLPPIQTSSSIAFAKWINSGSATAELAIPKTHLKEIFSLFTAIQQQMTMMQQPPVPKDEPMIIN
ncbi:MAG: hypothetical protein ABIG61_09305 [Planctomycetota bacterium]